MPAKKYIVGKRFGRLLVIGEAPRHKYPNGRTGRKSIVKCDCGAEKEVFNADLLFGATQSCGCLKRESIPRFTHGLSKTATHRSWVHMKGRCLNRKDSGYKDYGGRGITICARWRHSFQNFLRDMGEKPPGMMLERINNNKGYERGNCKWATRKEQNRNKRNSLVIVVRGRKDCLPSLCEFFGVDYNLARSRLNYGWSAERAFFAPKRVILRKPKTGKGEPRSLPPRPIL